MAIQIVKALDSLNWLRCFYTLVSHVVVSYLPRYIFYGNKHVIKHLNRKKQIMLCQLDHKLALTVFLIVHL